MLDYSEHRLSPGRAHAGGPGLGPGASGSTTSALMGYDLRADGSPELVGAWRIMLWTGAALTIRLGALWGVPGTVSLEGSLAARCRRAADEHLRARPSSTWAPRRAARVAVLWATPAGMASGLPGLQRLSVLATAACAPCSCWRTCGRRSSSSRSRPSRLRCLPRPGRLAGARGRLVIRRGRHCALPSALAAAGCSHAARRCSGCSAVGGQRLAAVPGRTASDGRGTCWCPAAVCCSSC